MDCYVADGYWDVGYTEADICAIVPTGSPGGGGTVSRKADPIRPNRRAQVRDMLADELDKAQRVDEPAPAIEAPKPRKKPARSVQTPPMVTTGGGLAMVRAIEAKVQAAIDLAALMEAEAIALQLALEAEDEADLETLLLAM